MMDWAPGDMALCVKSAHGFIDSPFEIVAGSIYNVATVDFNEDCLRDNGCGIILGLKEDPMEQGAGWNSLLFIKITPGEEDAEDREVIELYRKPRVPAHADR